MLKVLLITSEYWPYLGGIERYVEDLVNGLNGLTSIGLITSPGQRPRDSQTCVHLAELPLFDGSSSSRFHQTGQELARLAHEFDCDVIHFANAGLSCYADFLKDFPLVCTVHCKDLTDPWQRVPSQNVAEAISEGLSQCFEVICVSEYTRKHVARLCPSARSVVISPGVAVSRPPAALENVRPDVPIILTVSRLIERKGHVLLLRALERVARPFEWHMVGDGPFRDHIEAEIGRSSIKPRTTLHGTVADVELAMLYSQCTVFALTPIEIRIGPRVDAEGFGLVFLEAGVYGKPSISSCYGGCSEIVVDEQTGCIVDPMNVSSAAERISYALASWERLERWGLAAMNRVKSCYSAQTSSRAVFDVYERACRAR